MCVCACRMYVLDVLTSIFVYFFFFLNWNGRLFAFSLFLFLLFVSSSASSLPLPVKIPFFSFLCVIVVWRYDSITFFFSCDVPSHAMTLARRAPPTY